MHTCLKVNKLSTSEHYLNAPIKETIKFTELARKY